MNLTSEDMKYSIKKYCDECGSCENCGLSNDDAPNTSNCYTHASEEELEENYNYLVRNRYI